MRKSTFAVITFFAVALFTNACSSGTTAASAPTCSQLQTQLDACPNLATADKSHFAPFCATTSDACRACLDNHLCGVTEQCDSQCSKISDGGPDSGSDGAPADGGKAAPTCAALEMQFDACMNVPQSVKDQLARFCATASEACRSCLDGTLCGTTEQCDPVCLKISDAGGGG